MADQIDIDELVNQLRDAARAMKALGETSGTGSASNKKDTDRLIQALARLGDKFDKTAKTQAQRDKNIEDFVKDVDSAADSIAELDKAAKEQKDAAEKLADELDKAARIAGMTEAERRTAALQDKRRRAEETLRERRASKEEINVIGQAVLARYRDLQVQKSLEARLEALGDVLGEATGQTEYVQAGMVLLGKGLRDLQKRTLELSSAFVRGVGDLVMSTASFATDIGDGAKSFTQFNGLIDSVTNSLGEMAKAIPFAGEAISGAMKLTAEGSKFVLDQLQKTADSFNELGSVGALTAGGLTEFRNAQFETGVSLDVFTKAVKENSTTLAAFGGTVGSGTQRFTKILTPLTKQGSETSAELRRLGMSLEDISEATGGYIGLQTRLGRAQNKSNAELSQGAAEYAKELDTLAKLTGKSRKDIQDQQERAMTEGRFRAQYDEMVANGQEKQAKAMMDFTTMVDSQAPEMAAGLRDMSTGFTNSKAAQQLFADTGGAAAGIMERLKSGQIDQVQAYKELQDATRRNIGVSQQHAKAMGEDSDVFTKYADKSNFLNSQVTDLGKVVGDQKKQMAAGTDPLTDATVKAQQGMEQLSVQVQELGFKAMPQATVAINAFADTLNEFVRVISDKLGIEGLAEPKKETSTEDIEKLNDSAKNISDTFDIVVDPTKMIADAKSREEAVQRQQDANYKLATTTEKASIVLGETIDDAAEVIGSGLSKIGLGGIGSRMTALGASGREARVASQIETLKATGRMPAGGARAPGAAAPAGGTPARGAPAGGAAAGGAPAGAGAAPTAAVTPDQLFKFGSNTGSKDHFDKLDPGFRQALVSMAQDYNSVTGRQLNINSAYRTPEEQAAVNSGSNPKAQPGMSKHNQGRAADLNSNEVQTLAQMGLLSKYGFKTLANDPPHIYMKNGGVVLGKQGGTSVLAGEGGQNEAFVPLPDGRRIPVDMGNTQDLASAMTGGMTGIMSQLAKLIDLQSRNNKISEKLVRVSTN